MCHKSSESTPLLLEMLLVKEESGEININMNMKSEVITCEHIFY